MGVDYLRDKKALLGLILENTQAQTRVIEEDDMDALEGLILKRQEMMDQVDNLDQKAGKVISDKEILKKIMDTDQANQSLMKKEMAHVQGKLRKIRTGRRQEERYGIGYGLYKEEGVFFDTKE